MGVGMLVNRYLLRAFVMVLLSTASTAVEAGNPALKRRSVRSALVLTLRLMPGQQSIDFREREYVLTFSNRSTRPLIINLDQTSPAGMARLTDRRGARVPTLPVSPPGPLSADDALTL